MPVANGIDFKAVFSVPVLRNATWDQTCRFSHLQLFCNRNNQGFFSTGFQASFCLTDEWKICTMHVTQLDRRSSEIWGGKYPQSRHTQHVFLTSNWISICMEYGILHFSDFFCPQMQEQIRASGNNSSRKAHNSREMCFLSYQRGVFPLPF